MIYKILKDGAEVNTIVASPEFVTGYCADNGYTFEEVVREPDAEPETPKTDTDLMAEAYRQGVNEA